MRLLCASCISINSLFQKYCSMRKGGLEVLSTVPLTFQNPSFSTTVLFLSLIYFSFYALSMRYKEQISTILLGEMKCSKDPSSSQGQCETKQHRCPGCSMDWPVVLCIHWWTALFVSQDLGYPRLTLNTLCSSRWPQTYDGPEHHVEGLGSHVAVVYLFLMECWRSKAGLLAC